MVSMFSSQSFLCPTLGAVLTVIPAALLRLVVRIPCVPVLLVPGGRSLLLLLLLLWLLDLLLLLCLLAVWSPLAKQKKTDINTPVPPYYNMSF